jgi:hypothetical protein
MSHFHRSILVFTASLLLFACNGPKKIIKDEVILKNGDSFTGTILSMDSSKVKLMKMDESKVQIDWNEIDTIVGKRFKTFWFGCNTGFYNTPYFSVFRNEAINAGSMGFQFKFGKAVRGKRMSYFTWTTLPAKPYHINKFGVGFQRYIKKASYVGPNGFFWGLEYNLMNAKYNNGVQMTLDPFGAYDRKLNDQLRAHFRMGLQINLANKNNKLGVNFTVGIHYLKRNFKTYYTDLNQNHRIPKN